MVLKYMAVAGLFIAGLLALVWAYSYGGSTQAGVLDRTGPVVMWGLPVAKLVFNIAGAGTIGTLVLAAFSLPRAGRAYPAALRFAGWSALLWATSASFYTGLNFLLIANRGVADGFGPAFVTYLTVVDAGRAGALTTLMAAAVGFCCFHRPGPRLLAGTMVLSFAALVPLVLKSHATGGVGHADSTSAMLLHSGAAAVWLGGLIALIVLRRALPGRLLGTTVKRYSTLALVCFIVLAWSGLLAAWARITTMEALLSPYGVIVLVKTSLFLGLGLFGAMHRRWSLTRMDRTPERGGRWFAGLAAAELAVMGAASGLAAALGRTETPSSARAGDESTALPEPGLVEYLTQQALDPLWSLVCGFAVFFYLAAVRRLRAAGRAWPAHLTALWLAGVAVLFIVTNGGARAYQSYLFNTHVLTQMMLTAVVPLLLVPASPLTLAALVLKARTDTSTGPKEFLARVLQPALATLRKDPVSCLLILAISLYATYFTPLLGWSAAGQAGYAAATVLALLTGCIMTASMTRKRATAAPRPKLPVLAGAAALYAAGGWMLSTRALDLERPWYTAVGRPWGQAATAAPELGGTIMWTVAAISLTAITITAITKRHSGSPAGGSDMQRPVAGHEPSKGAGSSRRIKV